MDRFIGFSFILAHQLQKALQVIDPICGGSPRGLYCLYDLIIEVVLSQACPFKCQADSCSHCGSGWMMAPWLRVILSSGIFQGRDTDRLTRSENHRHPGQCGIISRVSPPSTSVFIITLGMSRSGGKA